jgi:hypothetical protein
MSTNNNSRKELITDNRIKLLSILFVISLSALPLTGCDTPPWESGSLLVLKVDTHRDGATVTTSTITVSGRVVGTDRKGAKVSINDADVPVNDDKFSANVALSEGKNVINIVATSAQAKPYERLTVTYVR